jgi:hypothetical protein
MVGAGEVHAEELARDIAANPVGEPRSSMSGSAQLQLKVASVFPAPATAGSLCFTQAGSCTA